MSKPLFAILRHKKLRTMQHVRGAAKHNDRTLPPKHAKQGQDTRPVTLHGPSDWRGLTTLLTARIAKLSRKPRRDQVRAIEAVLTASPKYFKPDGKGGWDKAAVDAWQKEAMEWLHKTHGDRLLQATLHRDEKSPHIHAVLLPEVAGRLCAKEFTAKAQLQAWQTSYAVACSPLGLERGTPRPERKHSPPKDYYAALDAIDEPLKELRPRPTAPKPTLLERVTGKAKQDRKAYEKDLRQWRKEVQQYELALRAKAAVVDIKAPQLDERERNVVKREQELAEAQHKWQQEQQRVEAMAALDTNSRMRIIKTLPRPYLEAVLGIPLPGKRDAVDILRDRGVVKDMREGVDYVFNAMARFNPPSSTSAPPDTSAKPVGPPQPEFAVPLPTIPSL